jgi:hypothetical protein
MRVDFWFDPSCPWCWMTSRWLVNEVGPARGLEIEWHPISLFLKNNPEPGSVYYEPTKHSLKLLRVFLSVKAAEGNEVGGRFYTEAGTQIHNNGVADSTAKSLLRGAGLPLDFAKSYDDEALDEAIQKEMAQGLALVGEDVGTPIIAIDTKAGHKGIFGPVISKVPHGQSAIQLWDHVVALTELDGFWELKRSRTEDPDFTTISGG